MIPIHRPTDNLSLGPFGGPQYTGRPVGGFKHACRMHPQNAVCTPPRFHSRYKYHPSDPTKSFPVGKKESLAPGTYANRNGSMHKLVQNAVLEYTYTPRMPKVLSDYRVPATPCHSRVLRMYWLRSSSPGWWFSSSSPSHEYKSPCCVVNFEKRKSINLYEIEESLSRSASNKHRSFHPRLRLANKRQFDVFQGVDRRSLEFPTRCIAIALPTSRTPLYLGFSKIILEISPAGARDSSG